MIGINLQSLLYKKSGNKYIYHIHVNHGSLDDISSEFDNSDYIELSIVINAFYSELKILICSFKKIELKNSTIGWVLCPKIDKKLIVKR